MAKGKPLNLNLPKVIHCNNCKNSIKIASIQMRQIRVEGKVMLKYFSCSKCLTDYPVSYHTPEIDKLLEYIETLRKDIANLITAGRAATSKKDKIKHVKQAEKKQELYRKAIAQSFKMQEELKNKYAGKEVCDNDARVHLEN